jgi:hypothetical protein
MSDMRLRDSQMQMARHLRHPEGAPGPDGVEERRLKIYRDLIYNNVEGFVSGGFPVLRTLYSDTDWHALVRGFLNGHRCQSPYFLEISQEFIRYLLEEHQQRECDPPFLAELAHYEWVELALDVSEEELPPEQPEVDVECAILRLSPLAWVLSYQYPVHQIGPNHQPTEPGQPTFLAVYRNRDDQVRFMELNAATARLLELLRENDDERTEQVLQRLADEMQSELESIKPFALDQLQRLLEAAVITAA